MNSKIILFMLFGMVLVGTLSAAAISDDLHVNIQVTDEKGKYQAGYYAFAFNITTDEACTNVVYSNITSLSTDSRGIISYYLGNVNLNFTEQYWLCYYRNGTLINNSKMGRVPYAYTAKNITSPGIIWNAATNTGNYNFTINTSAFHVDAVTGRIGIGTTAPVNALNVIGAINATTDIFTQRTKNLTLGYDYALNASAAGSSLWNANYSDYLTTKNYALNDSRWSLNYSDYLTTKNYALNDSRWSLNYSNFSAVYGYALNASSSGGALWNANYSDYLVTKNYALNDSRWSLNYSTFLTHITWANAVNGTLATAASVIAANTSLAYYANTTVNDSMKAYVDSVSGGAANWNANYSNFTTGWLYATNSTGNVLWTQAYNGTLAKTDAANVFGNFNQTFNTNTFFIDAVSGRVGVGTTAPTQALDINGDVNVEGYVFSNSCPSNMAYINNLGGYCIDKYEASRPDATTSSMGADTSKAVSQPGVIPWVSISQVNSRTACTNAGKHLCTDEEWLGAANIQGRVYYLPTNLASSPYYCVTDSSTYCLDHSYSSGEACDTGAYSGGASGCYSAEGVYDMIGNVWEWTNETIDAVNPLGTSAPGTGTAGWYYANIYGGWTNSITGLWTKYGNDGVYFPVTTTGRAVRRGGYWSHGAYAGPFCANLLNGPTDTDYYIGFRCCSASA